MGRRMSQSKLEFYTVPEVAKRLRVSPMTVYRAVHNGELQAARIGRSIRIPRAAIDAAVKPFVPSTVDQVDPTPP